MIEYNISELVGEQWLEDGEDGELYCPTDLAIQWWDNIYKWGDRQIWFAIRDQEKLFEPWEIEQDESYSKFSIPKPKKILLMSDALAIDNFDGIATTTRELIEWQV